MVRPLVRVSSLMGSKHLPNSAYVLMFILFLNRTEHSELGPVHAAYLDPPHRQ